VSAARILGSSVHKVYVVLCCGNAATMHIVSNAKAMKKQNGVANIDDLITQSTQLDTIHCMLLPYHQTLLVREEESSCAPQVAQ